MNTIRPHVVTSKTDPTMLSVRLPDGGASESFQRALTLSGAKPGDVIELRDAPPDDALHCHECGRLLREGQS